MQTKGTGVTYKDPTVFGKTERSKHSTSTVGPARMSQLLTNYCLDD